MDCGEAESTDTVPGYSDLLLGQKSFRSWGGRSTGYISVHGVGRGGDDDDGEAAIRYRK